MLLLASTSPTRKRLLEQAGLRFGIEAPLVDERAAEAAVGPLSPEALAWHLAECKALAVSRRNPEALVIGADQVLGLGNHILHKTGSLEAARDRLDHLHNRTHRLHAAAALARNGAVLWSSVDTAELAMRDFSPEERDRILALEGEEVLSSVGGYRLEGPSIQLFSRIEGDYFTILGLPLLPLLEALRTFSSTEDVAW